MKDIKARLEKIRLDAEDCLLISKLSTNGSKRETFRKLAAEYQKMAQELEAFLVKGGIPEDT